MVDQFDGRIIAERIGLSLKTWQGLGLDGIAVEDLGARQGLRRV